MRMPVIKLPAPALCEYEANQKWSGQGHTCKVYEYMRYHYDSQLYINRHCINNHFCARGCLTVITLLYLITTYVYQGAHLSPNIKCCTAPDIILYEDPEKVLWVKSDEVLTGQTCPSRGIWTRWARNATVLKQIWWWSSIFLLFKILFFKKEPYHVEKVFLWNHLSCWSDHT